MRKKNACDHLGLYTNNSKRLVNFYTKILGFKIEKEEILPKTIFKSIFGVRSACKFIRLIADDVRVEIFESLSLHALRREDNGAGYNHWGYCVSNRKKFIERIKRKNVDIIEITRNDHKVYFIIDPDGNRVEIRDAKE